MYTVSVMMNGTVYDLYTGGDLRKAKEKYLWYKGQYHQVYKYGF